MDDLPADALARVYVDGAGLAGAAAGFQASRRCRSSSSATMPARSAPRSSPRTTASASRAVRVPTGDAEAPELETFESELVEEVPAGAVAFLSFNDLGGALEHVSARRSAPKPSSFPFDPAR